MFKQRLHQSPYRLGIDLYKLLLDILGCVVSLPSVRLLQHSFRCRPDWHPGRSWIRSDQTFDTGATNVVSVFD
jgi:hypothetical protein